MYIFSRVLDVEKSQDKKPLNTDEDEMEDIIVKTNLERNNSDLDMAEE